MLSVYVLQLQNGKYYVGKTTNIEFRLSDHSDGAGSGWTSKYKPLRIVEIKHNCDHFDEDKYTKMYMAMHGIENVRGGSYSQLVLPPHVNDVLEKEIRGLLQVWQSWSLLK